ncbi:DMT family transporter [Halalkalibacter alkalisediminis]|uniref:Multidrug resistance efflux transporter family protein n=1 Tax=Halalkalibacter alkalisediminis TaxID=935616 RepID=A0ABV6NGS9_9BACI|nr:multidrug resistance efflux transporter family protein [Halalkalibacter alkalisediminis]
MKAILLGILSSLFFASTFILNRSMELSGGSWIWGASLRFIFMVPFLMALVLWRKNFKPLWKELKCNPKPWLMWSFIGFVLFYAPITFAAAYGPAWLIAGTWQFTIIAGVLLTPLFKTKDHQAQMRIPLKPLAISLIIFIGIVLIQVRHFESVSLSIMLLGCIPVIIACFAYPLGNRKMMEVCNDRLDTFQRVLGMTIASLPYWVALSFYGLATVGLPSGNQVLQSFLVAICSGVIATMLFFFATNLVRHSSEQLAAVEATISIQIIFVILGEVFLLASPWPDSIALTGIFIIIFGIMVHSYYSVKKPKVTTHLNTGKLKA